MKRSDMEQEVIAILCELTDAVGWSSADNKNNAKLAAFKEATRKLVELKVKP